MAASELVNQGAPLQTWPHRMLNESDFSMTEVEQGKRPTDFNGIEGTRHVVEAPSRNMTYDTSGPCNAFINAVKPGDLVFVMSPEAHSPTGFSFGAADYGRVKLVSLEQINKIGVKRDQGVVSGEYAESHMFDSVEDAVSKYSTAGIVVSGDINQGDTIYNEDRGMVLTVEGPAKMADYISQDATTGEALIGVWTGHNASSVAADHQVDPDALQDIMIQYHVVSIPRNGRVAACSNEEDNFWTPQGGDVDYVQRVLIPLPVKRAIAWPKAEMVMKDNKRVAAQAENTELPDAPGDRRVDLYMFGKSEFLGVLGKITGDMGRQGDLRDTNMYNTGVWYAAHTPSVGPAVPVILSNY